MTGTTDDTARHAQSVRARLRNLARTYGNIPSNLMSLLYAQQGFLGRLDASPHAERFVLKGGLSLFARYRELARPTQDIDLAAHGMPNTPRHIRQVMQEICTQPFGDGLTFDPADVTAHVINDTMEYPGVRVDLTARLGASPQRLQIDVSFGNVITPGPVLATFPPLLLDDAVRLCICPLETVISEKFAALVEINLATTRMKDLHDLHVVTHRETLGAAPIARALQRSFAARGTPTAEIPAVLAPAFATNPALTQRWNAYRRRTTWADLPELERLMTHLRTCLAPLLLEGRTAGRWDPGTHTWT